MVASKDETYAGSTSSGLVRITLSDNNRSEERQRRLPMANRSAGSININSAENNRDVEWWDDD
jgi:hypothetical protein